MTNRSKKNLKRKKKALEHKQFIAGLSKKYDQAYIQKQKLLPGSIYLNWILNGDKESKDAGVERD